MSRFNEEDVLIIFNKGEKVETIDIKVSDSLYEYLITMTEYNKESLEDGIKKYKEWRKTAI